MAEQKNRTLFNMSCSLAVAANLPAFLWEEYVRTANTIINFLPTQANLGITPFELLYGKHPNVSHLRVFGSTCHVHINTKIKKLDPRAVLGTFVGYDNHTKGYRIYIPQKRRVIVCKNVRFDEYKAFYFEKRSQPTRYHT